MSRRISVPRACLTVALTVLAGMYSAAAETAFPRGTQTEKSNTLRPSDTPPKRPLIREGQREIMRQQPTIGPARPGKVCTGAPIYRVGKASASCGFGNTGRPNPVRERCVPVQDPKDPNQCTLKCFPDGCIRLPE